MKGRRRIGNEEGRKFFLRFDGGKAIRRQEDKKEGNEDMAMGGRGRERILPGGYGRRLRGGSLQPLNCSSHLRGLSRVLRCGIRNAQPCAKQTGQRHPSCYSAVSLDRYTRTENGRHTRNGMRLRKSLLCLSWRMHSLDAAWGRI